MYRSLEQAKEQGKSHLCLFRTSAFSRVSVATCASWKSKRESERAILEPRLLSATPVLLPHHHSNWELHLLLQTSALRSVGVNPPIHRDVVIPIFHPLQIHKGKNTAGDRLRTSPLSFLKPHPTRATSRRAKAPGVVERVSPPSPKSATQS